MGAFDKTLTVRRRKIAGIQRVRFTSAIGLFTLQSLLPKDGPINSIGIRYNYNHEERAQPQLQTFITTCLFTI